MPHYVTTNNANGEATFSSKVPTDLADITIPGGSLNLLWTTWKQPISVSNEDDIDQYAKDRTEGIGMRLCPEEGNASAFINLPPNSESLFHRTMTIDIIVVLQGIVELHLDGGEKRVLTPGDSVVQRAGKHKWINITESGGWVKMFGFSQPVVDPVEIGGKQLTTDWGM